MKYIKTTEMDIKDAIALCHMRNEFGYFNFKLMIYKNRFLYDSKILTKLDKISHGQKVWFSQDVKEFYKHNKRVIDIINKYSNIASFIENNYSIQSEKFTFTKTYIYQYILENSNYINNMLVLLNQLNNLGIKTFEFNEKLDFTNETYQFQKDFLSNIHIEFVDNIEILPSDNEDIIKYKTSKSNYKMILWTKNEDQTISSKGIYLYLKSLIFDSNTLPKNISKETTFDIIVNMSEKKEENKDIPTTNIIEPGDRIKRKVRTKNNH